VLRKPSGAWRTRNITFGGAGNGYYGLAGTVSTASGSAQSVLGGSEVDGQRQLLHRFDLAFQVAPGGGTLTLEVEGQPAVQLATHADAVGDAWHPVQVPQGARTVTVSAAGDGPVTVYGISLETAGPGVTWETLGVAGASQTSIFRQGRNHLARQIAHREPDLIVYQMGGNELGYPSLKGNGKVWRERYVEVVQRLRAGAPDASCLLVTPLDQGERVRGEVHSKPTLNNMIRLQREVARELGCAFWDARAAMGGPGSFGTWMAKKLAWSDLYHLTGKGLALVGNTLADAMEVAYDDWRRRNPVVAADTAGPGRG
jgi:lysophospholipase L1-like esterase